MPSQLKFPIRGDLLAMEVRVDQVLYECQSPFQKIEIVRTEVFGDALLLDGHIQLTTFDEFSYHESLVHIPLSQMAAPKTALVVGGGDGGVIRELCKRSSLESIDMVEIDQKVIDACRRHLPTVSNGAFDDPRVHLVVADAFPFVQSKIDAYDLIVVDSTDTYEEETGELSEALFTLGFYKDCLRALTRDGIVVTQSDNPVFCPYSLTEVLKLFGQAFPYSGAYSSLTPSFGGYSAYAWGSRTLSKLKPWDELHLPNGLKYLSQVTYDLGTTFPQF